MGELYILPDGPQQEMRDQMLKTSKLDTEPDPESQRFEWVDVMPTPETELGEWDDWIVGFDGVEYVSLHFKYAPSGNTRPGTQLEEIFLLTTSGRQGRSLRKC